MGSPGSPRSGVPQPLPSTIPIPSSWTDTGLNAVAGPSSEGALPRRPSRTEAWVDPMQLTKTVTDSVLHVHDSPSPPKTPSSAPPTPSVISVTHPSQFIHTHHPRRGSMTPLGLNLISPNPPALTRDGQSQPSSSRSVGFQPGWSNADLGVSPPNPGHRRGSAASTTSTLTQSRPPNAAPAQHSFYPPNWNAGRRRSSLTPSAPSLAPPSPTRAHVGGRTSRPVSSDGSHAASLRSSKLATSSDSQSTPFANAAETTYGRRGSLPHLGYGGWNGHQKPWNPVLPPPRGSVEGPNDQAGQLPDSGFKFGSVSGPSSAASALRNIDLSPSSRRASLKRKEDMDVFEQAEEEEAERQRRAFLAATFGADGKRARDRLSLGGQGGQGPPSTPSSGGLRRQSLLLWERMGHNARGLSAGGDEAGPSSAPPYPSQLSPAVPIEGELGQRRGSLPVAIPGGGLGRSASRRSNRDAIQKLTQVSPTSDTSMRSEGDEDEEESSSDDEEMSGEQYEQNLNAPLRPLPPLLPLSDPGPRLLPSTLALHRANHLLQSRNLHADPLPHPLPPSLHPPDPVDVAEFDIDFILAGSQAQLGGQTKKKNAPIDVLSTAASPDLPVATTLKLGGDEEDTFAKFVGEFDDEYGGRRGEWTFRSCPSVPPAVSTTPLDPLDASVRPPPKAEWESIGAGRYELFPDGEIRAKATGRSWRVHRLGNREYELEEVTAQSLPSSSTPAGTHLGGERFTLAGKTVHRDQGGVKLPYFSLASRSHAHRQQSGSTIHSADSAGGMRATTTNSTHPPERKERLDSHASTVTMTPAISHSAHFGNAMAALGGSKKKRQEEERERMPAKEDKSAKAKALSRQRSKEDSEAKKERGLGNVLKRGFLSSIKHTSLGGSSEEKKQQREAREEREREKAQAHSWGGASNVQYQGWFSGSSRGSDGLVQSYRGPSIQGPASRQTTSSNSAASSSDDSRSAAWSSGETQARAASSATSGEENLSEHGSIRWKEGKAWNGVPDEAVAMIIPLEEMSATRPSLVSQPSVSHPFFSEGPKRALLVWYVPFNSEHDDPEARPSTASAKASISEPSSTSSASGSAPQVGSLPKLQKLLRRRASKDKEALKKETQGLPQIQSPSKPLRQGPALPPLPFRSFRVVARVVNTDDLRSNADSIAMGRSKSALPFDEWSKEQNVFLSTSTAGPTSFHPSPSTRDSPGLRPQIEESSEVDMTGRNMSTVIAVCHSRSQGVEFVLEGLDRLGLCKGESAWGPTGYEEWRGTGLSEKGRELLDILWAGCTGVMGLSA